MGMDPISMVVAVVIAAGSGALGIRIGRRRERKRETAPVCRCGHSLAFHDPHDKQCHGLMNGNPTTVNEFGRPTAWERVRCTCRQYVGPLTPELMIASYETRALPPLPTSAPQEDK